ncbi:hypothetical protein [Streptomyces heilongjiangensis]|uniref:DUF308 domain-containing protein n=1 Tax=Streptomyces heilongjiangensis TaxID=945052 RepID=A0ABW1B1H9_9ACTN
MAEHDSEREPEEKGAPLGERHGDARGPGSGGSGSGGSGGSGAASGDTPGEEQQVPFDEDAAWRAIVAGFGEEPPDPPGAKPFRSVEDLALLEADPEEGEGSDAPAAGAADGAGPAAPKPLGSSVAFAPGVGSGPRDYTVPDPVGEDTGEDDDEDDDGEGHFVPPEPPPLPEADATAKFAWLGVVGGPVLLLLAVLLGWDMTWWLTTLGIGGFLGGFATLVMRMKNDDEDDDDPGRGAVV